MIKPSVYYSDDYGGMTAKNASFYFGYEHSICKECGGKCNGETCDQHPDAETDWCFVAKLPGREIVIPSSKLGSDDKFNIPENLLLGIGWVLAKYNLVESNE